MYENKKHNSPYSVAGQQQKYEKLHDFSINSFLWKFLAKHRTYHMFLIHIELTRIIFFIVGFILTVFIFYCNSQKYNEIE